MTLRAGMRELVTQVRQLSSAELDEFTLAGQTYWSDDHLQSELDKNRADVTREKLSIRSYDNAGTVEYYDYYFVLGNPERAESGTAVWRVENSAGSTIGTADYTVNYDAKHIRFTANTQGSVYYLSYRAYDVNRAAAGVWRKKAANVSSRFDIKTDNHDLKRSQLRAAYLAEAQALEAAAGGREMRLIRSDAT